MQAESKVRLIINVLCLSAYVLIVAAYIGVLTHWYSIAVTALQLSRATAHKSRLLEENRLNSARSDFFKYVSLNQAKLRDASNADFPEFVEGQRLLSKIHPDLLLKLGSTTNLCRDVMITSRVCSGENSCLQCLLLLREAPVLKSIRIGLGAHPHQLKMRVHAYYFNNIPYKTDPSKMRYAVSPVVGGARVILFCDDLLSQSEWSSDFSDFGAQYKPSDLFLDSMLGEYLRKHVREVSIRGKDDPAFATATDCLPSERFRRDVATAANIPVTIPAVSSKSYIYHSVDSEKNSNSSVSGWYRDRCKWSFELHSNDSDNNSRNE
ncbi:MAG: hypothetical protein WCT03_12595 [Candidatus Obscuribacterales bacterium]|jgi:hypothetical protein